MTEVGNRSCYVLEARILGLAKPDPYDIFCVRIDDWLIVRNVTYRVYDDRLLPPDTSNYPHGMYGPFQGNEPRLPRFPLQVGESADTMFKRCNRGDLPADLREIPGLAAPAMVDSLLSEGDTTGGRVVRPVGTTFLVRSEIGGNIVQGPQPGDSIREDITQSLQLWSEDQPWRLYEEYVQFDGVKRTKLVLERSWLVASGHSDK